MKKTVSVLVLSLSLGASASTRDIFTNHKQTRRYATAQESAMVIEVGNGCAGFLLAPNVGMSAAHCTRAGDEVTSAGALFRNLPPDGKITKTLEIGTKGFDLWIFEIEWDAKPYPSGIKIVSHIQTRQEQLKVGANAKSDPIFTVGFPADVSHGKLVLAAGYGKSDGANGLLLNNISVINGNSGGGIWRGSDRMLVSLVSGGPHRFEEPGWDENDWEDPNHWNWGPAIWQWYSRSKALPYLYPNGISRFYKKTWDFETLPGFGFQELM